MNQIWFNTNLRSHDIERSLVFYINKLGEDAFFMYATITTKGAFYIAVVESHMFCNAGVDHYNEIKGISICEFLPPHLVIYVDKPAEEVQKKLKASGKVGGYKQGKYNPCYTFLGISFV